MMATTNNNPNTNHHHASGALELQDVTRVLSQLVMPSPRKPGGATGASHPGQHSLKHLAPIEMAAHSIHLHQPYHNSLGLPPPPSQPHGSHHPPVSTSSNSHHQPHATPASVAIPLQAVSGDWFAHSSSSQKALGIQGWAVPVGYTVCGLCMGLCNLIEPRYTPSCAHLLCPIWSISVGLHAATETDALWAWWGGLCVLLLPFVIAVQDYLFAAFYLLVFAGFSSGRFWQTFQGPSYILLSICWGGLLLSCGLSGWSEHPCVQISIAGFFAIVAGIISSTRLSKLTLRIG